MNVNSISTKYEKNYIKFFSFIAGIVDTGD
jgi:hypothetical protein